MPWPTSSKPLCTHTHIALQYPYATHCQTLLKLSMPRTCCSGMHSWQPGQPMACSCLSACGCLGFSTPRPFSQHSCRCLHEQTSHSISKHIRLKTHVEPFQRLYAIRILLALNYRPCACSDRLSQRCPQTHARHTKCPLDELTIVTEVSPFAKPSDITGPPALGTYIHGLFLEVWALA